MCVRPRFERWIERFVPDSAGHETARHARLIPLCALTVAFWGPVYLAANVALESSRLSQWVIGIATLAILATPYIQRKSGSPVLAGNWMTLILFATVVLVSISNGGHRAAALSWSIGLPVLALAIANWAWMVFWLIATVVMQASFYALYIADVPLLPPFSADGIATLRLAAYSGLTVMLLMVTWIHARQANAALEQTNERLRREVHEHQQTHNRLERAEQLEALGRVVAGVGHEINNPLSYILANIELLDSEIEGLAGRIDANQRTRIRELIKDIRAGGHGIRDAVQDISVFSRNDRDAICPVSVRDVVEQSLRLVQSKVRHSARIVKDVDPTTNVWATPAGLGRVLVNLILNAADALPQGRSAENEIRIVVRTTSDDEVAIEVADTGHGIAKEHLQRIFQPFFTTKEAGRGTGLGLAMCYELVQRFGGRIEVNSSEGRGTTFYVYFKAASRETLATQSHLKQRSAGTSETRSGNGETDQAPRRTAAHVLVVDDDSHLLRTICRTLRRHEVDMASTGQEAMDACARKAYDVILCDLMMPDVTGMELHTKLCERHPELDSRFLFMTGGAVSDEANAFCDRFHDRVLYKPFEMDELRNLVDRIGAPGAAHAGTDNRAQHGGTVGPEPV